jgi:hypothetical protein
VALPFLGYAHCRSCGNLDLHRVSHHHMEGLLAAIFGTMGIPAYRCAPCRRRFFALLPNKHLSPVDGEIPEMDDNPQPAAPAGVSSH